MTPAEPLRSYKAWQQSVRNFAWLQDAVSGAMDVDLMVERKGHFLIIEGKPWHSRGGIALPYGQHRALYQLSRQPNTTVYLLGEDGEDVYLAGFHESPSPKYWRGSSQAYWPEDHFQKTTKHAVRMMLQAWWERASNG